ncbi:MAG TPA: pitrilysin family protein, partial [Bryobacteraceae bacterium]|nr:pitrilysin family protein [Bryobacteraceae bacterium]
GHPYARQEPTLDSIDRLDRAAVIAFRNHCLAPNKATLVLAGDFPAKAMDLLQKHFGDWQAIEPPTPPAADFPAPRREIVLIDRAGSVQADIRIARLCVTRTDPDYFPLLVGNTVLGGAASSRLFMNVREEKGYAYDARSVVQPMRDGGMFTALTQVRNEVLKDALSLVLEEMHRIGNEPISAGELATVKNYLSGTFVLRLETLESLAAQISATKMLGLPVSYLEQYTARVRAVDPEEILAAAARYMNPDPAAIVVVGDAEALAPQLEHFGKIRIEKAPE